MGTEENSESKVSDVSLDCEEVQKTTRITSYKDVLESLNLIQSYIDSSQANAILIDQFEDLKDHLSNLRYRNLSQSFIFNYFKKDI